MCKENVLTAHILIFPTPGGRDQENGKDWEQGGV